MTRSNQWHDPPEMIAALARGPRAYAAYCRRVIEAASAADSARRAEREAADLAERRARNAERMRVRRAAQKGRERPTKEGT